MIRKFIDHLFDKKINSSSKKFSYTLYLGVSLFWVVFFLFLSGILLSFYYFPTPENAYKSLLFIEENVFLGKFIRSFHRMLTHILLILSALHILRTIFSGVYKWRGYNYKIGYISFLLIIFYAYTGYLLPYDQLSFWATTTGMELIKQIPFGDKIVNLLVPFEVEDGYTLLRFYVLHVILLPIILTFLLSIHMYVLRKDKLYLQLPSFVNLDDYKNYVLKLGLFVFMFSLLCSIVLKAPLGPPADFINPPNPAKSAWFLLWIQEVVSIRGYLFNILVIIFIVFLFLPEISMRKEGYKWFSKDDLFVLGFTFLLSAIIVILTIVAYFFRGENWSFVF